MGNEPRPLSELSPMAQRRNSPSWNPNTKQMMVSQENPASPRLFWQGRDSPFQRNAENQAPYNPDAPNSPTRRASIEHLKRASRVRNNQMFRGLNPEYDPTQVYVPERPLATGRSPQKQPLQGSMENVSDSGEEPRPSSPSKDQASPAKSSLSKASRFGAKGVGFDPHSEIWSDYRHAKSVTFDAAPPQINEYEMTTPDPSSAASGSRDGSYDSEEYEEDEGDISFDHDSSGEVDDSFDASLEDTEKTPVVLPDDWRDMSNDEQVKDDEEPFTEDEEDATHTPDGRPPSRHEHATEHSRVDSLDSNGEPRPLPPLPSVLRSQQSRPSSPTKLSTAFELGSGAQRTLPAPPGPATCSKEDIAVFSNASMPLEDRLRLMAIQDDRKDGMTPENDENHDRDEKPEKPDSNKQESVENQEKPQEADEPQNKNNVKDAAEEPEIFSPPRISRDSILRDLRQGDDFMDDSDMEYNPDVPIPSLEDDEYDDDDDTESVVIKEEDDDDDENDDLYDIPDYYETVNSQESSLRDLSGKIPHDSSSHYSLNPAGALNAHPDASEDPEDRQSTPVPPLQFEETPERPQQEKPSPGAQEQPSAVEQHKSPVGEQEQPSADEQHKYPVGEQEQPSADEQHKYPVGELEQSFADAQEEPFADAQEEPELSRPGTALDMSAIRETLQRPATPENDDEQPISEPSTPGSVIHHPVEDDDDDGYVSPDESVPPPVATIKARGASLKTRPSLTPADLESMAATRRKISGSHAPPVPSLDRPNSNDSQQPPPENKQQDPENDSTKLAPPSPNKDVTQRQSSLMKLDIPFSIQEESLGFGLDKEFDRVMENQKVAFNLALAKCPSFRPLPGAHTQQDPIMSTSGPKDPVFLTLAYSGTPANSPTPQQRGYLMRQNTKVIVASSHNEEDTATTPGEAAAEARLSRTPGNTTRKPSQQTWTTVPWNSGRRRSSIRTASGIPKKKPVPGSVPPLPGQESNVQEATAPVEDAEPVLNEALAEGEERGRLFVKVVGIKYLDLPLPKGERSHFALTLDNGLHCVTTAWLELGKSAPIGQEFELIVHNDLEFQLTLQMQVDEEKLRAPEPAPPSPTKQKTSTLSRVFQSPRKRKELEMQQHLTEQRKSQDVNAGVWDRLRTTVAQDGSFARAYIALSDHEKHAFGRPYTVDVACFNEWGVEDPASSVKSKKSTTSTTSQRRPPYKIGKLELQLLFVPKPKGAKDDDMPKSMNSCIREMQEAESVSTRTWEGFLSQQGGDCPYWRRRFFKLVGSKLTAYHETTRQPRATINLTKAAKLIDDRSSLTQRETTTRNGGRRKSAFAEEEEGYMFVEEGFRIRFANGEVIDFYADSAADKDGWMKVLADSVGKGTTSTSSQAKPWTELVLKRERSMKTRRNTGNNVGSGPAPAPPAKNHGAPPATSSGFAPPAPAPTRPRHKHTQSHPEPRNFDARRAKTRSLIF